MDIWIYVLKPAFSIKNATPYGWNLRFAPTLNLQIFNLSR